ncbi:Low affinity immunoglobulin epsilon Fc receptor [Mizuhopecten yessoensis]|uniref:Low affinity immunoglobulin epsilon Fc receptor n=1 Tax=Mizuhopecten yessoensis TaxID=6573 RepID=A0A210PIA5_MIZYE|nr:Low affinity immunoglobulin epsilon Fc receptor [Mizuhopecten yessoensis]
MLFAVILCVLLFAGHSHGSCPAGYLVEGEFCFFFSEITGTWAEANSYCRTFNAVLFEPNTEDRQTALAKALQHVSGPNGREFFIGGSDFFIENQWIWSTEQNPITISHWSPGNPSDSNIGEDCMAVVKAGQWNDIACDRKLEFICERGAFGSGDIIG